MNEYFHPALVAACHEERRHRLLPRHIARMGERRWSELRARGTEL